jgi:hypothetical protein
VTQSAPPHPGQLRQWTDDDNETFLVIGLVEGARHRRWSIMTRTGTLSHSEWVLIKHSEAINETR